MYLWYWSCSPDVGDVGSMIRRSLGVKSLLVSLVVAGALASASCGTAQPGTAANESQAAPLSRPARPDPLDAVPVPPTSSPDPAEEEQHTELYEYCDTAVAGDPLCHTSRFGNDLRAADEFLEGVDVGPGGLVEMTATDDGFPAGSIVVGTSVPLLNATFTVDISEVIASEGACEVLLDRTTRLGVVTDLGGSVQAFLIMNPVVATRDGIRIGSTLADLQARYPVDVQEYGTGKIAYIVREDAVSHYDAVESSRAMLFYLSPENVVEGWVVGATSYVRGTLSQGLCPGA